MAIDWNQLLKTINSGLQVGSQFLPRQTGTTTSVGGLQLPNQLLGAGLLTAGALTDKEPGEVTEARQFLRNRFTSPTALTDQFSGQLGALSAGFQPMLKQKRDQDIAEISQRFAAAFPSTVGAQGGEFGTLSRYISEEALPREQGLLSQLGLNLVSEQGNAAKTILDTSKPDAMSQLATILGYDLLARNRGGQGGTQLLGQNGQLIGNVGQQGQLLPSLSGGLPAFQQGAAQVAQLAQQAGGLNALLSSSPQMLSQISQLLGAQIIPDATGALTGIPGYAIQTSHGVLIPADAVNLSTLGSAPSAAGSAAGTAGLAPGLSGVLGALGAGAGGFFAGQQIGSAVGQNQAQAGVVGAASGAAAGAAIGSILPGIGTAVGAVIGGLAGAFGGWSKERQEQHAMKAQRLAADLQSAASNQKKVGAFWVQALASAGFEDLDSFKSQVDQITANINDAGSDVFLGVNRGSTGLAEGELIAQQASRLLIKEIQKTRPDITDLDQVVDPNTGASFRQAYIDYLLKNYTIESGGSVVPATSVGQFGSFIDAAGINR